MRILFITFLLAIAGVANSQEPESFLERAKQHASQKEYAEAQDVLSAGLEKHPGDHDLRSYQIRVHLWEGDYSTGKILIDDLLSDFPNDYEGFQLLITYNWWSERWESLLNSTTTALSFFPKDQDFKLKKIIALKNLEKYSEATDLLEEIVGNSNQIMELKNEIKMKHHQQIEVSASYAYFNKVFDPWILGTVRYQRISRSSLNVSATYGTMFNQSGASFNAEYYPRISKNLTGFLEIGGSQSVIFPELRGGAELTAILKKFELSVGAKMLQFQDQDERAKLFTAGLGKYFKNYFVNYKAWFSQVSSTQSLTHTLLVRRSFKNRFHYIQLNISSGATPLQINNFNEISRVNASAINVTYSQLLFDKLVSSLSIGGQNEEYLFGTNRLRYTVKVGLSKIF